MSLPLFRRFVAMLTIFLIFPVAANAVINNKKTATWNMQGSNHGSEEKWGNAVRHMIDGRGHVDILALQEMGSPPPSAVDDPSPVNVVNPDGISSNIRQMIWRPGGSRGNPIYIYWIETGLTRVIVGLVTTQRPNAVVVFENPNATPGSTVRQIIGVRYGADDYYSYHAGAYTNNESGLVLQHIYQYYQYTPAVRNNQWLVMADWNRSPSNLRQVLTRDFSSIDRDLVIYNQAGPTQQSGGNLDYAVFGQVGMAYTPALLATLFIAQLAGYLASDHTPVFFR
jgi:cytolethal distending toxin subunit B